MEDKMSSLYSSAEITDAELPDALLYYVQMTIVKSGFVMGVPIPTLACYDATFIVIDDVHKVAALVLKKSFASRR